MGIFHQTHLGWTATKHLSVVDLQGPPVWPWIIIQPKEAYILHKLPDELLLMIAELSCHKQPPQKYSRWRRLESVPIYEINCVMTLSQVCHRFKRIAQPLLFDAIILGHRDTTVPPSMRILKLHRTLRERVDLRRHCQSLEIIIAGDKTPKESAHYSVAKNLLAWLTKTKRLYICDSSDDYYALPHMSASHQRKLRETNETWTWDLIRHAVAKLKHVEDLEIDKRGCVDVHFGHVLNSLHFPKLRSLGITSVSSEIDVKLRIETRGTAPFTRLIMYEETMHIATMPILIQWPAVLTHFEFEAYPYNPRPLSYSILETWLSIHKGTLTYIKICCAHQQSRRAFFSASLFPKLQYLQLWRIPTNSRVQDYGSENESLLGDSLETFRWDYTTNGYDCEARSLLPLGETEISWIRRLAELASKRKAALKSIVVRYTVEDHIMCRQSIEYPWEHLKAARDYVSKLGIDLVYDEPQMSKEELMHYYATGKDPTGKLNGNLVDNDPVHYVHAEPDKEEELRLVQFYDDLVEESRYHGEDIHKYLLE